MPAFATREWIVLIVQYLFAILTIPNETAIEWCNAMNDLICAAWLSKIFSMVCLPAVCFSCRGSSPSSKLSKSDELKSRFSVLVKERVGVEIEWRLGKKIEEVGDSEQ
jgi:hypothetical protein